MPYRKKLSRYTSLTYVGCDKLESYASILHMPNFLRMYKNLSSINSLVKISANCWLVQMNLSFTSLIFYMISNEMMSNFYMLGS